MALPFCSYFLYDVEKYRDPYNYIQVAVTHPTNLCTICTLLKSTDPGLCFAADSMGLSSFASRQQTSEKRYIV